MAINEYINEYKIKQKYIRAVEWTGKNFDEICELNRGEVIMGLSVEKNGDQPEICIGSNVLPEGVGTIFYKSVDGGRLYTSSRELFEEEYELA